MDYCKEHDHDRLLLILADQKYRQIGGIVNYLKLLHVHYDLCRVERLL